VNYKCIDQVGCFSLKMSITYLHLYSAHYLVFNIDFMFILKYATKLNITTIAMINSGGMRAKSLGNSITLEDLLNVFPYENSIDVMELKGGTIRKVLEKSAKLLSPEKRNTEGGFIQVSGKFKNVLIIACITI
jgi:2',3'-cyclic-nucleotide 2'-phosphodiesterase (5'-nucleotidase family)